ncbi:hypothetical protein LCGC14_0863680 [marine sediment metagenome]|uniref:LamG-like jellyroll fold domain-containing protein n=1 Tax=marine sediment metagenome TaxID=412755 RepID=A0A0F9PS55_9ZZZZ
MPKSYAIWSDFRAGELTSLLDGQIAFEKYYSGCKTLQNFIPRPQGPASNRTGFRYIADSKNSATKKCRLVSFEFSTTQAYIIEFGDLYCRFYRNQGQIDSGGSPYEIVTTYTEAELPELQFTQSADILYIAHPSHAPATLSRTGHTSWTLADIGYKRGPFLTTNITTTTISSNNDIGTGVTLTASSSIFNANHVGGLWRVKDGVVKITAYSSGTSVTGDIQDEPDGTAGNLGTSATYAQPKFGTAAGLFDADGDYLTVPDHADWDFSGGSWTVDCWIYTADALISQDLWFQRTDANNFMECELLGGNTVRFRIASGGSIVLSVTTAPEVIDVSTWHHVEVCEDGNNYYIFIDGTLAAFTGSSQRPANYTGLFHIGAENKSGSIAHEFNGWIDEFRVSNGVTRNTSGFIPPITEYSSDANTKLLLHMNGSDESTTFTDSGNTVHTVTANGDAQLDTGTAGDKVIDWAEGAWSADEGWPTSVTFFEQRLWWSKIQTLYSSKSGDYTNMEAGTADDDAIIYTIAARHVNKIHWLSSGKILAAGTAGGEFKIAASSVEDAITPLNVRVAKESSNGSAYHEAIEVKDVVLYLQKGKRQILEFSYRWENQTYVSPDMTDLAEHITKDYIEYMAYQQLPFSILWCVRNDGVLAAMTYDRLRQMIAWHRHITTDSTGDSSFESVAVIPSIENNGYDEVWVVVNRTINGGTVRYIEMLEQQYDGEALNSNECFFLDSGLTYNGASTTTISGLDHLEGELVAVIGDGVVQASKTVSSGSITIDTTASRVHAGLAYDSVLQTMRVEQADAEGTSQGRKKRINQVVLRLKDAKQYKYGKTPTGTFKEITETALFSGDKEVEFIKGWGKEGHVTIKQEKPLPITVLAIIAELDVT